VVVGDSHSEKIVAVLRSRGEAVQHLPLQTYHTSTIHAGKLREGLQKMKIRRETVIVL
jgi:hypothetical protein